MKEKKLQFNVMESQPSKFVRKKISKSKLCSFYTMKVGGTSLYFGKTIFTGISL